MLKVNHLEFRKEIERRNIECLIHFTTTLNLYGIIEQGAILSRESLEGLDVESYDILDYVQFTDKIRYDDARYINLSVSRLNSFLFSRFSNRTLNDPSISWCVLKIDPSVILLEETLFSVTNAASYSAQKIGINGSLETFKRMFSDTLTLENGRSYTRKGLLECYPTDIQAEVLVKDIIDSSCVKEVCFQSKHDLVRTKAAFCDLEFDRPLFKVDKSCFKV